MDTAVNNTNVVSKQHIGVENSMMPRSIGNQNHTSSGTFLQTEGKKSKGSSLENSGSGSILV